MEIKIKLYGDLREKAPLKSDNYVIPNTLKIKSDEIKIVKDILNKFNIKQEEISHIFVNGIYSGLDKEITKGDRVGIFPKRMGIIFEEIKSAL